MFNYIGCAKRPRLFNRMSVLLLIGWMSLIGILAVSSEHLGPELLIESPYRATLFQVAGKNIERNLTTPDTGTVL